MTYAVMTGNELLIQGGLEAGIDLYTGYPGSPLADFFNILYQDRALLEQKGARVVIGNSEANAAAMASGAKQAGRNTLLAMKSMGLHVASDALSVGNFANPGPVSVDGKMAGVVVAVGDDPWSISTSTPADSRYLFKHLHLPFLEPSNPQELKDWVKVALELSQESSLYTGLLLTTFMAEGGGRVVCGPETPLDCSKVELDPATFNLTQNVMVPPNSFKADQSMIEKRFPRFQALQEKYCEKYAIDQRYGNFASTVTFVSSGVIFESLKEILQKKGLLEKVHLIKVGCPYPLAQKIASWLSGTQHLVVVEEKRGFLEQELLALLSSQTGENRSLPVIHGKKFFLESKWLEGFPAFGGLNAELLNQKVALLMEKLLAVPDQCSVRPNFTLNQVLPRLPTFCPGCPHRETLSVLKELRQDLERQGIKLLSHGDVGCYSLSFLQPFKEMHNLSAMGQGGALGAGVDLFTDGKKNPSVVLMGDSTFFHSGLTDISNSVQMGHAITYILLDNDNTAMTGHQMSPSTGQSVEGKSRPRQSIPGLVRSFGVHEVLEIHPSDRYFYKNLLLDFVHRPGVKVIISNKECALTFGAKKRAAERDEIRQTGKLSHKVFYQINTDACEDCRVCVEMTGCPGLSQKDDAYGVKTFIDPSICVSDSYCTQFKVCPSFEKVIVEDYAPIKIQANSSANFTAIPQSLKSLQQIAHGQDYWRAVIVGVGGSGVTTASKVLAKAATGMEGRGDLDFKFMDQKGLAQRNGRVTGHLALHPKATSAAPVTPQGMADLVLSTDLLDGSQSLSFLSESGHLVIEESFQVPMQMMLDHAGKSPKVVREEIKSEIVGSLRQRAIFAPAKTRCQETLGNAVYASTFLLGVAFQLGALPFTHQALRKAIEEGVKRKDEVDNNLAAFELGREYLLEKKSSELDDSLNKEKILRTKNQSETKLELLQQSLLDSFLPWQSARTLLAVYDRGLERLMKYFPDLPSPYLAQYLHDIFIYDRGGKSEDFLLKAGEVSIHLRHFPELQREALAILARTYFVKDEVFVSHQMISPVKLARDRALYQKMGRRFTIHPKNKPVFPLGRWQISFEFSPKPWMLKIMRHQRFLRLILPGWHRQERSIQLHIRAQLMKQVEDAASNKEQVARTLKRLGRIKGYRDVYYQAATQEGIIP
jgi:indolepyruvate ferredoxin oxidoreductase